MIVDARTFQPKAEPKRDGCRTCGKPLQPRGEQRHCSSACSKAAYKRRKAGEPLTYEPGVCGNCGANFVERPRAYCSARCRQSWQRQTRAFEHFRSLVEWPLELPWLAKYVTKKTKRPVARDNPLLPKLALALAERGELVVYVGKDGTVASVGKPKQRARS